MSSDTIYFLYALTRRALLASPQRLPKDSRVVITGLVRDAADKMPNDVENLLRAFVGFKEVKMLII